MRIAIGSLRTPKIEAVKAAMHKIAKFFAVTSEQIEFLPREVESGTARTPMSIEEMMLGAYNRAKNLKKALAREGLNAEYYFGLEGGLFSTSINQHRKAYYLQSWVYVLNGSHGYFGSSPAVQIPQNIAGQFEEDDFELADVMDRIGRVHPVRYYSEPVIKEKACSLSNGVKNNRDRGGAFSLLTRGLLTRQAIFESAVLAAMAPFYNPELYT
jgi:non-canonical (house-cleaning) NTP pyrophosphatase